MTNAVKANHVQLRGALAPNICTAWAPDGPYHVCANDYKKKLMVVVTVKMPTRSQARTVMSRCSHRVMWVLDDAQLESGEAANSLST